MLRKLKIECYEESSDRMINYIHVFILIMIVLLLKTTVFTNRSKKQILAKSIVLIMISLIVLLIIFNKTQTLLDLIELDIDDNVTKIDISHVGERTGREVNDNAEILKILEDILSEYSIKYTMKTPVKMYSSYNGLISIDIWIEDENKHIAVTGDNELLYKNKIYDIKNKDLFNELIELIYSDL